MLTASSLSKLLPKMSSPQITLMVNVAVSPPFTLTLSAPQKPSAIVQRIGPDFTY